MLTPPARESRRKELCGRVASGRALSPGWGAVCGGQGSLWGWIHKQEGACSITSLQAASPEALRFLTRHSMTRGDVWPPSQISLPAPGRSKKTNAWLYIESAVGDPRGCVICSRTWEELPGTQKGSQRSPHSRSEDCSLRDGSRVLEAASWGTWRGSGSPGSSPGHCVELGDPWSRGCSVFTRKCVRASPWKAPACVSALSVWSVSCVLGPKTYTFAPDQHEAVLRLCHLS